MTSKVSLPTGTVPFGFAVVNGAQVPVTINQEWMLAFEQLLNRTGGVVSMTTQDFTQVVSGESDGPIMAEVQRVRAMVEQIERSPPVDMLSEISSIRMRLDDLEKREIFSPDVDTLRREIDDLRNVVGV
jgi:hypothetical protein